MINELFADHLIRFNIRNYWDNAEIEVLEVWPRNGAVVEIDIVKRFKNKYE